MSDANISGVERTVRAAMAENDEAKGRTLDVANRLDQIGTGVGLLLSQLEPLMGTLNALRDVTRETMVQSRDTEMQSRPIVPNFLRALAGADPDVIHEVGRNLASAQNNEADSLRYIETIGQQLGGVYSYLENIIITLDPNVPNGGQVPAAQKTGTEMLERSVVWRDAANSTAADYLLR
jgi:hypothetical protein